MIESPTAEQVFEDLCREAATKCAPIANAHSRATPDYLLTAPTQRVIAEVKSLLPNRRDQEIMARVATGTPEAFFDDSLQRLRSRLRKVGRQIRPASLSGLPTLAVIVEFPKASSLDEHDVLQAMYGDDTMWLARPSTYGKAKIIGVGLAGNRTCTPDHNTSVSAVAIVYQRAGTWRISIYHNTYARYPLDPRLLVPPAVHLKAEPGVRNRIPQWQRLTRAEGI